MFDVVDVLIDFHGYVTGYGVSPDSRFGCSLEFHSSLIFLQKKKREFNRGGILHIFRH